MTALTARPCIGFPARGLALIIFLQRLPNFLAHAVVNLHQPIALRVIRCNVTPATLGLVDLGLAHASRWRAYWLSDPYLRIARKTFFDGPFGAPRTSSAAIRWVTFGEPFL